MRKPNERRSHERTPTVLSAKLQCRTTGRYLAARTRDVSAGGVLLEIDHPSLLVPGQPVRVGVAWDRSQAVIRGDTMMPATVVRSLGLGPRQHVACQFEQAQTASTQQEAERGGRAAAG